MLGLPARDLLTSDAIGPLVGLSLASGILCIWAAAFWEPTPKKKDDVFTSSMFSAFTMFEPWQYGAAPALAGLAWLLTGWPSIAAAAAVFVLAAPTLAVSSRSEADFAERTEAVAGWVDSLRDTMRGARGIEGAIRVTANTAPLPIRPALKRMNRRVSLGIALPDAMAEMADEYDNEVCDLVVSVMVNALDLSAAQLPSMLDTISQQARSQAHAHLQVHTSRAKSRTQLRLVAIIVFLSLVMFFAIFADYLAPLDSSTGQFVVALALAVLGYCVLWIARLSAFPEHGRVLDPKRGLNRAADRGTS